MTSPETIVHATCVAKDGRAVLLSGPSGVGKSDLALRLIDRGWSLVSDDRTILRVERDRLLASPPETIAGRIEMRGLGILQLDHVDSVPVLLTCDLGARPERFPLDEAYDWHLGRRVTRLALDPFPASAPILVERALQRRLE